MGLPRLPPPLTPAQVAYIQTHLYEDQGPRVVATSITLMVLVVLAVVLRFIARNIRKLPWEIDDYFMLPALVGSLSVCGAVIPNRSTVFHCLFMCHQLSL